MDFSYYIYLNVSSVVSAAVEKQRFMLYIKKSLESLRRTL